MCSFFPFAFNTSPIRPHYFIVSYSVITIFYPTTMFNSQHPETVSIEGSSGTPQTSSWLKEKKETCIKTGATEGRIGLAQTSSGLKEKKETCIKTILDDVLDDYIQEEEECFFWSPSVQDCVALADVICYIDKTDVVNPYSLYDLNPKFITLTPREEVASSNELPDLVVLK
jgi:hypothetical protein